MSGRRKDKRGWQAERIYRRRNLGGKEGAREQGEEDSRGQPHSHIISHQRVRVKVRYIEEKKKITKAKCRQYNLTLRIMSKTTHQAKANHL